MNTNLKQRGAAMGFLALLAILAVAAVYSIMLYNGLVSLRHNVSKALGQHRCAPQAAP